MNEAIKAIEYETINTRNYTSVKLLIFIIALSCQLTDITIGPVKFWELLAIIFFPFFIRRVEKKNAMVFTCIYYSSFAINIQRYD